MIATTFTLANKSFHFVEIRNNIYALSLFEPMSVKVSNRHKTFQHPFWKKYGRALFKGPAALLHTCRQIRFEFGLLYFSNTRFYVQVQYIEVFCLTFSPKMTKDAIFKLQESMKCKRTEYHWVELPGLVLGGDWGEVIVRLAEAGDERGN